MSEQRHPARRTYLSAHIRGQSIDDAVAQLAIEAVNPVAIELSFAVQQQIEQRYKQADALRRKLLSVHGTKLILRGGATES